LLQTVSGKLACFPANITYLINMILEESQRNVTSCLLENPVPCTGIAEEPHTTSGTKPQTLSLRLPHKTPLLLFRPLFQIHLAGYKNSQQNMGIPGKDLLLFWRARLKQQTSRRPKEERD
jgi:hypothetical protein